MKINLSSHPKEIAFGDETLLPDVPEKARKRKFIFSNQWFTVEALEKQSQVIHHHEGVQFSFKIRVVSCSNSHSKGTIPEVYA